MAVVNTNSELIESFTDSNQRVINWFTEIPASGFFSREGEAWSASDNLDHLFKSHKPIAKALKLPKVTLRAMFGSPEQPSMTYEALCQMYLDQLAQGAVASGRYLPDQTTPENPDEIKVQLIDQFAKASSELVAVVENWQDADLDQYLLPHPLLGKLTIREMVYFTIYHNLRHASPKGD